jgi:hypothetical protein
MPHKYLGQITDSGTTIRFRDEVDNRSRKQAASCADKQASGGFPSVVSQSVTG